MKALEPEPSTATLAPLTIRRNCSTRLDECARRNEAQSNRSLDYLLMFRRSPRCAQFSVPPTSTAS